MAADVFPPVIPGKQGFYSVDVYEEALQRYPTVTDLVIRKAEENGNKTWLLFGDESYTFAQVNELSNRLATGLHAMGIRSDDKVGIFALNSPQWIMAYFAILKLGAVPVTVNTGFIKDPLVYNLQTADVKYLVLDSRLLPAYKEVEEGLKEINGLIIIGKANFQHAVAPAKRFVFIEELLETDAEAGVIVRKLPRDPSAMILTSGTTGRSKVVVDSHAQFITTALFMLDAGGVAPDSTVYVYLPLFHIMALDMATISSMLANARMVLVEKFSPTSFWEDIRKYGVSHFHAVGPILEMLFKSPPSALEVEHGRLTAIAYASKEVWIEAQKRFHIAITGGYGSTEVGIPISSPHDIVAAGKNPPGSCGHVGPHVEVGIMNEQGCFLPPGQVGEIVVRPRIPWTIFLEYYGMPRETVAAFAGLWFHTGDAGYVDDAGYLYFVDRVKDAIRRRGENISSYEVEQMLLGNPGLAEAAVIPAASEVGEDEVMAVVAPRPGQKVDPEKLIDYCLDNMPRFWIPRYIRQVESLPRTPTGRIEKFKLRGDGITPDTLDMREYINTKKQIPKDSSPP